MAKQTKQNPSDRQKDVDDRQQLYTDKYFESGHWLLKIWQTIIAILGWLAVILPITITVTSFWASFNPINQRKRKDTIDNFIDNRFGSQEFRENVKTYTVQPEQNLDTHQIQDLYAQHDLDDIG